MLTYQQRSHELVALALERFAPELTIAEHAILVMSADHDLTDPHELAVEQTAIDPALAAEVERTGGQVPPDKTRVDAAVRRAFVRWLVSDPEVAKLADRRGLLICGARFPDGLSLQGCTAGLPVTFAGCDFTAGPDGYADFDLKDASFPALSIHSSTLGRIDAMRLRVATLFELSNSVSGPIGALNSQFGQITIMNTELRKLSLSRAMNFTSSTIGGALTLSAIKTADPIMFNSCSIESVSIVSSEVGAFDLIGCDIKRWLTIGKMSKVVLDQLALNGKASLKIADAAVALCASGPVSFKTTSVGGNIGMEAMRFRGDGAIFEEGKRERLHNFLDMTAIKVAGFCTLRSMEFDDASASLDLTAGEFGKDLDIKDLAFPRLPSFAGGDDAVTALAEGIARSGIDLFRARVAGDLRCTDLTLPFATIDLRSAVIVGGSTFNKVECYNLIADRLKAGKFVLAKTVPQNLTLRSAEIDVLADDATSRALRAGGLHAAGLSVKAFETVSEGDDGNAPRPHEQSHSLAADRIAWLNRQPPEERVSTRPWLSLAAMLDNLGQEREAKTVRYEMRVVYADQHPNRAVALALRTFARIRRNPFIVLWWTFVIWVIASGIFCWHRADFVPTGSPNAFVKAHDPQQREVFTPQFAPPVYALENTLPIVRLGQDAAWAPDPRAQCTYCMLSAVRWFLIIWGWFGGAVLAFAVGQKLKD